MKTFPLRTVLTVTTGLLLTKPKDGGNGIGDLYDILNHMTGDNLFTHQLGRAGGECKPWLVRWFPELDSPELQIEVATLQEMLKTSSGKSETEMLIVGWLSGVTAKGVAKEEYAIERIPMDDHETIDPYDELVQMRGTDEGVLLVDPDGTVS